MFYLFPNELTVRTDPSGGGVTPTVIAGSTQGPAGRRRLLVLCHGYANSLDAARESYMAFLDNFAASYPEAKALLTDVFKFYWPGDERIPGISQASYPFQIAHARAAGQLLGDYLKGLPTSPTGVTDLYLIAHSLGNRVVLELLREIVGNTTSTPTYGGLNFAGIFMMAAAVPVGQVDVDGELHAASLSPRSQWVLFSPDDWILHYAFPAGETAGFDGWRPQAVGRFGNPGQWSNPEPMPGYGHSDYWPTSRTSAPFADFLNVATDNHLPTNQLPVNPGPARTASNLSSQTLPSARPAF